MREPVVLGMIRGAEFVFACPWCDGEHTHRFKNRRRFFLKVGDRLGPRLSKCRDKSAPGAYVLEIAEKGKRGRREGE